jgi:hypothetical protein
MDSGCLVFLLQGFQQKWHQYKVLPVLPSLDFQKMLWSVPACFWVCGTKADTPGDVSGPLRLLDAPRYLNFTWEGTLLLKVSKPLEDSNRSAALRYPALNIQRLHSSRTTPHLRQAQPGGRASRTLFHFDL